ncbi:GDT1-like protein 4 [Citrus sinensis]|nr:GDT1-like protein 4 [Citrus sinensis]
MTVLSEIGDKTFFAAAILAMRHPRRLVLSGCLGALIVMTILSAVVGWVAPNLDADFKANAGATKEGSKAFSITFFGEWGDKSQLATIGLAADENPFGVVLGGIIGQALCTTAAVVGGKSLASQISEKIVALSGGVLFIVFGIQSFLSPVKS